jgi:hypothetical protein
LGRLLSRRQRRRHLAADRSVSISVVDGGSGAAAAATAGAIPTAFSCGGSTWLAGVQAGCNYQSADWVFGIETDMSGTKLNDSQTIATNPAPQLRSYLPASHAEVNSP